MFKMNLAILYGIISMLGFGLGNAISKRPIQEEGVTKVIFFRAIFLVLLLAPLLFFLPLYFSWFYISIAALISILGYFPLLFYYKGVNKGKVGVITPISNSSIIFTVLFSVLFFGEKLLLHQYVSIFLVIVGVVLISINFTQFERAHFFSSGIHFALIASFLWGLVFFLFKIPNTILGPILTSFIIELFVGFSAFIHLLSKKTTTFFPKQNRGTIFCIALFGVFGILFFNLGISLERVSVIMAFNAASPLVASIGSAVLYKEKLSAQQWLAIAIIIGGLVTLVA